MHCAVTLVLALWLSIGDVQYRWFSWKFLRFQCSKYVNGFKRQKLKEGENPFLMLICNNQNHKVNDALKCMKYQYLKQFGTCLYAAFENLVCSQQWLSTVAKIPVKFIRLCSAKQKVYINKTAV